MNRRPLRDVGASVRRRLFDLSREQGEEFQDVLTRYALERLLYRIGCSDFGSDFVLKGAMLFNLWGGAMHRATRALLDFPPPNLLAYPRETVIAEKFQAMVVLGIANSRMKDFYDVWVLAREFPFEGTMLCQAIQRTFARRRTPLPIETPLALTPEFSSDVVKQTQWRAFVRKGRLKDGEQSLSDVVSRIRDFLLPPILALTRAEPFELSWSPSGPWR